jgi:hypothetical protein
LPDASKTGAKPQPRPKKRGRPKRGEGPNVPWPAVDLALVHGERQVDPQTGDEVLRYPSLADLAERYGVSRTLLWKFARRRNCYERRKEAQLKTQARTDDKVIEKVSSARAAATSDVAAIVDTFISGFRKALDEGKIRVDSPADLDRLVRLRELVLGRPDGRSELQGQLSLEAIQLRHRRLRGQVEGLTPEIAGTQAQDAGDEPAAGGEEAGDGPAH